MSELRDKNGADSLKHTSSEVEIQEEGVDTQCGYTASCKPALLQKCANVKAYLVIFSLASIIQGFAVNGINNVNISSYERRYLLSSKDASLVASIHDIAAGLTVLFVGYFGGTGHQPRYLGFGVASIGLGTFVMSLAHFTAPLYEPINGLSLTCDVSGTNTSMCDSDSSESNAFLKNYLYILLLGQALNGFGGTCLYSLDVTYLDESVSNKVFPLYIGILAGAAALGPAIGYVVGGSLLELYVDFPRKPPPGLTSTDPSWVGAWWLGFVITAICATALAFLMFLFPKELPDTAEIRASKISEAHDDGTEQLVNASGFGLSYEDMPKATWYLLKNPTFMCITAMSIVEMALVTGLGTFWPKYISNQFAQPNSLSSIITGALSVSGAAFGQLLGGYLCKRFQLKVLGILKFIAVSSGIVFVLTPVLWARCEDPSMAGLLVGYPGSPPPEDTNLNSLCNQGCDCSTALFEPVCADGIQYFSPCYAGCPGRPVDDVYHGCSCPTSHLPGHALNYTVVTNGKCHQNCVLLYAAFIPVGFLVFFFTFIMVSPLTVVTLRVVPDKQRAFAIALKWVFLRFLGSIPGPIVTGAMIDASCSLWETDCEVRGSCWVYDNFDMSRRLFILAVVLKIISIGFSILACFVYKAPPDKGPDTESYTLEGGGGGV